MMSKNNQDAFREEFYQEQADKYHSFMKHVEDDIISGKCFPWTSKYKWIWLAKKVWAWLRGIFRWE